MSGAICCSAFNSSGVKHIDPTAGLSQSASSIWEQFEMVSLNFSPSVLSSLVHDGQSNKGLRGQHCQTCSIRANCLMMFSLTFHF